MTLTKNQVLYLMAREQLKLAMWTDKLNESKEGSAEQHKAKEKVTELYFTCKNIQKKYQSMDE